MEKPVTSDETTAPPLLQFCIGGCWKRGEETVRQIAKASGLAETPGRNTSTEVVVGGRKVTLQLIHYCLGVCGNGPGARVKPHEKTHVTVYCKADSPAAVEAAIARLAAGESDVGG